MLTELQATIYLKSSVGSIHIGAYLIQSTIDTNSRFFWQNKFWFHCKF